MNAENEEDEEEDFEPEAPEAVEEVEEAEGDEEDEDEDEDEEEDGRSTISTPHLNFRNSRMEFRSYLEHLPDREPVRSSPDIVLQQMMAARGFHEIADEDAKNCILARNAAGGILLAYWYRSESKMSKDDARKIVAVAKGTPGVCQALIVAAKPPTSCACKLLRANGFQVFQERELRRNILHHELVPRHEVLTGPAKAELLRRVAKSKLPRLPETDAVAKFHCWKPGTVVRIVRQFGQSMEPIVVYRVVV